MGVPRIIIHLQIEKNMINDKPLGVAMFLDPPNGMRIPPWLQVAETSPRN